MARKTLPEKRTLYTGLQKGVRTRWKARGPVSIAGVDYSMTEVDDILQQLLDSIRAVELAEGALHGAVTKRTALELKYRDLVNWVVDLAQMQYGKDAAALAAFALKPAGVPGPKTTEVKAASAAKAATTRKERGTMGPRQRKKLRAR